MIWAIIWYPDACQKPQISGKRQKESSTQSKNFETAKDIIQVKIRLFFYGGVGVGGEGICYT